MGFTSVSLDGSDAAAEAWERASDHFRSNPDLTVREAAVLALADLRDELADPHNEWNTPGAVNAALVLVEGRLPLSAAPVEHRALIRDTLSALQPWVGRGVDATDLIRQLNEI